MRVALPLHRERNLSPTGARRGRSPGCAPRSKTREWRSGAHQPPTKRHKALRKKVPGLISQDQHPPRATHAEGTTGRGRGRQRVGLRLRLRQQQATGPAILFCSMVTKSRSCADASTASRPRLGQGRGPRISLLVLACAHRDRSEEGRDAGFVRSRHASAHRAYQPDQAQQRRSGQRPSRTTGRQLHGLKPGQFTKRWWCWFWTMAVPSTPCTSIAIARPRACLREISNWLTVEYAATRQICTGAKATSQMASGRDLKAHQARAFTTFADANALNTAIHQAVDALNLERTPLPLVKLRISA